MKQIRMQRQIFSGNIEIQFIEETNGRVYVAMPLEFKLLDEVGFYAPPFMSINPTEAQQMIDELWNCGLRPSEGSGSAGALAATEKHLKDMQKIVFHTLKIQG